LGSIVSRFKWAHEKTPQMIQKNRDDRRILHCTSSWRGDPYNSR
jgi:hypothetical protein